MPKAITLDYCKIAKQLASIKNLAKKQSWQFFYDDDLDDLYFSPKRIPDGFITHSINDEYDIYVDSNSNVGGIFIEYFKSNFITHNNEIKSLKNIFTKKTTNGKTVPEEKQDQAELLSNKITLEILSQVVNSNEKFVQIPG